MQHVSLEQAATCLPQLVSEVTAGEDVILMQGNEAVARLIPIAQPTSRLPREPGSAKDIILHIANEFDAAPEDFSDYLT